ncbi:MAG: ATP synthase F1 subunit delta [Candidatus Omnitrophica bacterium]|nr:ATP synthase F1 subunit delta [Candidatus Omnitrophota bacterium]
MKEKIIAKRYAEAFIGYAGEYMGIAESIDEIKKLRGVVRDNPQMREFLSNPGILDAEKGDFIDSVFKEGFSQELRNFLKLLVAKERTELLIDIADYVRVNYTHVGGVDALLKCAYPLELENIREIKKRLEDRFRMKMNLYLELDADLLGGVQVTIGNVIIDGSLRRRLEDLNVKLKGVRII